MSEEIKKNNDEKIIKNIKNYKFERKKVNANESKRLIKLYTNVESENLKNKLLFFYIPPRLCPISAEVITYTVQLEEDMKEQLGIRKIIHTIQQEIKIFNHIDLSKGEANEIKKANNVIPYDTLKRLENFYQLLIEFALQMIHNFMWIDFVNNVQSPDHWGEIIKDVIPIILYLKRQFEVRITREVPKELLTKIFKNDYTY